MNNTNP